MRTPSARTGRSGNTMPPCPIPAGSRLAASGADSHTPCFMLDPFDSEPDLMAQNPLA